MQLLYIFKHFIVLSFVLAGCYYDVEEELYGTTECTTTDISYVQDIVPILRVDCYDCHSVEANFGNITIEGHSQITEYVNDGSLLGSINYEAGYSPMPQGGSQLLDCEIAKIEKWIIDGAPNN